MGQGKSKDATDEAQRKQQEFVAEVNRVSLERQIQLQNQMRQRIMAMQVARARELFFWLGAFYGVATLGMLAGFRRTRKPGVLVPLLPLTFVVAYHGDMAYGNKLHRIRTEAENIMQFEEEILDLPCGLPTTSSLDLARMQEEEEKRFHPHTPPL
ncbi:Hypothetical predicted protein [Cloeon dipterum]|uniref:Plasminogen receptor (KT) n=1 Tax=Cloeon dipterum TaxID=197152 RepID=A0A8S1CPM1_9INSE|nr:Hypothetical predicted protein [Cloeon dipterum]